jgi:hypothetical protein
MARSFTRASSEGISYTHLSAIDGAAKLAMSFWVYPTASTSYDTLLGQLGAATGAGTTRGFSVIHELNLPRKLQINVRSSANDVAYVLFGTDPLTLDTWQHVTIQFDGGQTGAARIKLFVNAVEQTATANSTPPTTVGTTDQPFSLAGLWSGRLAEVALWTGVTLDATQRTNLAAGYAANDASLSSGLVFYAPLDSSVTSGVNDLIGPYTGTATGTSVVSHPSGVPAGGGGAAGLRHNRAIVIL